MEGILGHPSLMKIQGQNVRKTLAKPIKTDLKLRTMCFCFIFYLVFLCFDPRYGKRLWSLAVACELSLTKRIVVSETVGRLFGGFGCGWNVVNMVETYNKILYDKKSRFS